MASTVDLGQDPNAGEPSWARALARRLAALTAFAEGAPGRARLHTASLTRWVAVTALFTILFVDFARHRPAAGGALPAVALSALVNVVLGLRAQGDDPAAGARCRGAVRLRRRAAVLPPGADWRRPEPVRGPAPGADRAGGRHAFGIRSTVGVTLLALVLVGLLALAAGPVLAWRAA